MLLTGARQVGKTTLLLQAVQSLLDDGIRPENILYATFDHPLLKLIGLDGLLRLWHNLQPPKAGPEFLLLDEIQYTQDWQTWLKHQVDFEKGRRIAVTGSAMPLQSEGLESGVGRWHTIKLATLSFSSICKSRTFSCRAFPTFHRCSRFFPGRKQTAFGPLTPHAPWWRISTNISCGVDFRKRP